jgi:hypothetical protein
VWAGGAGAGDAIPVPRTPLPTPQQLRQLLPDDQAQLQ